MRCNICKLVEPTVDDFRKNFIKPEKVIEPINVNHGWIAPNGAFFRCSYAGHEVWAENLMSYWHEMVEENKSLYSEVIPCPEGKPAGDYLVSQGWMKWQYRDYYHEIITSGHEIHRLQWERIGWLNVHSSTDSYKIIIVEFC